jgi:small subunit ribosomal protein S4e
MAGKGNRIKQKRICYDGRLKILKKQNTWLTSKLPGPYSNESNEPLGLVIKMLFGFAENKKEVKYMLNNKTIKVNGIRIKKNRFPIGIFDIIEFEEIGKSYKIHFDRKGRFAYTELKKGYEKVRPSKISNKTTLKNGKLQLTFDNGFTVLIDVKDKDKFKVADSVIYDFEKKSVKSVLKFEKGAHVFVTSGRHVGKDGNIKEIIPSKLGVKPEIVVQKDKDEFRTLSNYVMVLPKE